MGSRVARRLLVAALVLAAAPAAGQESEAQLDFELGRSVQQSLARIQESWLQWVSASLQDNEARAAEALEGLTVSAREVGFRQLPDLAAAAVAQARESTRQGNWDRAERQLVAAERLDPGQPETRFARASLAWARGDRWRAFESATAGIVGTLTGRAAAKARTSFALWTLLVLLLTSALFVALLAARHGAAAGAALRKLLAPAISDWVAGAIVLALLVAPLALPAGPFWLFWIASIAVWSFASRSERLFVALGWLLVAVAPLAVDRLQRELALDQTPPMRAWRAFEAGRLYGGFFSDVQVMRTALPTQPAALELAADLHRTLGQWDVARSLYRRVLLAEPQNVPVLLNLGAYSFRKGDSTLANAYFRRATETAVPSAAAWFNLSLGYSESYLFDESRAALGRAREIDGAAVDVWMATPNPDRVLTFNGSLARRDEVRAALVAAWTQSPSRPFGLPGGVASLLVALTALLLALLFDRARRGSRFVERRSPAHASAARRWAETLLPALEASRRGAGGVAWINLALLAALLTLPAAFELTGDLPVSGWPGPPLLGVVAGVGALAYLGLRIAAGRERTEG